MALAQGAQRPEGFPARADGRAAAAGDAHFVVLRVDLFQNEKRRSPLRVIGV